MCLQDRYSNQVVAGRLRVSFICPPSCDLAVSTIATIAKDYAGLNHSLPYQSTLKKPPRERAIKMHLATSTYCDTMFAPATSTPHPSRQHGACFRCTFISNTILIAHFIFLIFFTFLIFAFMVPFSAPGRSKRAFRFERSLSLGWFIWLQCLIAHAMLKYYTDPWADVMASWRGMVWRQKAV